MRNIARTITFPICLIGLLIGLNGCGGVYESSVSGVVTLDSASISRGTVTFKPKGEGPSAYGQIGLDGEYKLRTGREYGVPSGQYLVTVVANEPPPLKQTAAGGPPPPGPPITPAWYRNPNTSGLEYTVEPGSNKIDLELTTQPPAGWQDPAKRRR